MLILSSRVEKLRFANAVLELVVPHASLETRRTYAQVAVDPLRGSAYSTEIRDALKRLLGVQVHAASVRIEEEFETALSLTRSAERKAMR
jgi:hypothetical protein